MDIAKAGLAGDIEVEHGGLKFFLDQRASEMLYSTTIDFMEGQGFVLTGMQSSCGSCKC